MVRRFKVRPRDPERYARLQWRLTLGGALTSFEEEDFVRESVNSNDLYALPGRRARPVLVRVHPLLLRHHLGGRAGRARALPPDPVPPRRAVRAAQVDAPGPARGPRGLLPRAGRARAGRAPGRAPTRSASTWSARASTRRPPGDAERFRRTHRVLDPFILYAGRKAAEKNTPLLVEYFARYKLTHPQSRLKLVLIGSGGVRIPGRLSADILDLGFVTAPGQGGRLRGDPGPLPAVAPRELLARHDGGVAGRRTLARPRALRRDAGPLPRVERRPLLRGLLRVRRGAGAPRPGRRAPPADGRGRARVRPGQLHVGPGHGQLPRRPPRVGARFR